jgi:tRNA-specific 2-thiouridylase
MAKKVVVGMSGGVDSSVTALLLKKQGYDVIGVTMRIWQDEDNETLENNGGCCGLSAVDDARRVAYKLGIPYYVLNFKEDFKKYVIDNFIDEYLQGRTPNPCIACNRYVKWESMLSKAVMLGADYIATGHYANVTTYPKTGRYTLKQADNSKDQTYALYSLTQYQLSKTLMPVGEYTKPEIRQIAEENGLLVANKPDSQDICFVPDGNYGAYIRENYDGEIPKGDFVDRYGNKIGEHTGICDYTIGQRKGLGIALGYPAYVCGIDPEKNEVTLGINDDLFSTEVTVKNFNYMAIEDIDGEIRCYGKLRYSAKKAPCKIFKDGDFIKAVFDEPQRAATPGQAAVFYDEDYVLGGGVIVK